MKMELRTIDLAISMVQEISQVLKEASLMMRTIHLPMNQRELIPRSSEISWSSSKIKAEVIFLVSLTRASKASKVLSTFL
jgi:sulfopyruvate decarboxylase TPP-binding subunit